MKVVEASELCLQRLFSLLGSGAIALRSPASERSSDLKRYSPDIHLPSLARPLLTTLGVVISDGKDFEDSSNTTRGTVDDEEGDMRRRGARECDEALMEATEARRGYGLTEPDF